MKESEVKRMFGFALYKDLNNLSHEITSVVHCI